MGRESSIVFIVPEKSDVEVEEVYTWLHAMIGETLGPGRDLQGGPTYALRDYLRALKGQAPRVFGEMLREASNGIA